MKEAERVWAKETLLYTDQWLELGILTDAMIELQKREWSKLNADRNTEHYRYGAWRTFWQTCSSISDDDLAHCISLATSDPDLGMGKAILHDIIKTTWISDEQFRNVISIANDPSTLRLAARHTLFRSLKNDHSDENLDRVARKGETILQRHILDNYALPHKTLKYLEEEGRTRAVRNVARQRLRRKK